MDKVTLDGKTYERSAIVAKRYGYTADYLGQLSRAEKVDAQLVGRSWYVHAPSVEEYQAGLEEEDVSTEADSRPASLRSTATVRSNTSTTADEHIDVETDNRSYSVDVHAGTDEKSFIDKVSRQDEPAAESPKKTAVRSSAPEDRPSTVKPPLRRARSRFSPAEPVQQPHNWQKVAYERDDDALAPRVSKEPEVPPVYEIGKRVRVHNNTEKFSLVASAMPEVALRGNVAVQGVEDPTEESLSLHYQDAGSRVQQQLSSWDTETASASHEKTAATADASAALQKRAVLPRGKATVWATRLAWTSTFVLLLIAVASIFLAQETAFGDVSGSSLGLVFAPAEWWYQIWPF